MSERIRTALRQVALVMGVASVIVLGGCRDPGMASLEARLDALRQRPEGGIEALPPAPNYRSAHYTQAEQRSPFRATRETAVNTAAASRWGGPDRQRPPGPLERFTLERLELVGTLTVDGRPSALIRAADGRVYRVFQGDYLGTHFGRITAIHDAGVVLLERVRDVGGEWRERRRTLSFDAASAASTTTKDDMSGQAS